MDLMVFDNVNFNDETERVLIELASVLNSLSSNNPDIDFSILIGKVYDLYRFTVGSVFDIITRKKLALKNDEL